MIVRDDISDFFDLEVEEATKSWEALMKLPIKDRIRKRKAIQNVFFDKDYKGTSDDGYVLLRLIVGSNLSDFKEGECLILHHEESVSGIKCTINAFENDDAIILEVFPPNMPVSLASYFDEPLILDKDLVDLRENVFYLKSADNFSTV